MKFVPIEEIYPYWGGVRELVVSLIPERLQFITLDDNTIGLDFMWFEHFYAATPTDEKKVTQYLRTQLNGQINLYFSGEMQERFESFLYHPMTLRTLHAINYELLNFDRDCEIKRKPTLKDLVLHVMGIRCCISLQNPPKKVFSYAKDSSGRVCQQV